MIFKELTDERFERFKEIGCFKRTEILMCLNLWRYIIFCYLKETPENSKRSRLPVGHLDSNKK